VHFAAESPSESIHGGRILGILRETDSGAAAAEMCSRHRISDAAYYNTVRKDAMIDCYLQSNLTP